MYTGFSDPVQRAEFPAAKRRCGPGGRPKRGWKTTLLRILCGLRSPDEGRVLWNGQDISKDRTEFQAAMAYVGHAHGIKGDLTPQENLRFWSSIHPVRQDLVITDVLQTVGLGVYEHVLCRRLSAGQRRRVALARLPITDATLWFWMNPLPPSILKMWQ